MNYPPVFQIANDSPAVRSFLWDGTELRFWPFGTARPKSPRPYAVHQLIYGTPDNSLSCVPTEDNCGIQIDAFGKTVTDARDVAAVLSNAFEDTYNHVVGWNGEFWDQPTGLYRVSFTVEFWTERSS